MRKIRKKIFVLSVGIIAILFVGSCQPQAPSEKMSRLIAVENSRLQKELELRNSEIERLTKLHNQQSKKQDELLTDCMKEKESWKKRARQNLKNQVEGVFDAVMEKNAKLLAENEKLKAEIEKLRN
jgi:hypothetical protein